MSWSAAQYTKFEAERTRPVRELLAALPDGPANLAIDLGCGPGNSTERLAARLPGATIIGVDSSADMIAAARQRLPHITFETADLAAWTPPAAPDVILANAVLQWLPDHETLFPALIAHLAKGGHLAVQMPDNLDEPAHRLMRDVAAEGPWAKLLAGAAGQRTRMASADAYYAILRPHCAHIDLWRTTYYHVLTGGAPAVVEWFIGSGLRPFLAPLDEALRAGFLERYTEAISLAYPALADGDVLLPFPRLFFVGSK